MNHLQKQIEQLERSMTQDANRVHKEQKMLQRYTQTNAFVVFEIGAGFLAGYLLARKKHPREVLVSLFSLSKMAARTQAQLAFLAKWIR